MNNTTDYKAAVMPTKLDNQINPVSYEEQQKAWQDFERLSRDFIKRLDDIQVLRQEVIILRKDVDREMDRLKKLDEFINGVNELNRELRNFCDGLYVQGFDC